MSDAVQPDLSPELTAAQRRSVAAHRRAIEVAIRAAELHETAAELQDVHVLHLRAGRPGREGMVAAAQKHAADERERAATARAMADRHREALRGAYGLDE